MPSGVDVADNGGSGGTCRVEEDAERKRVS